MINNEIEIYRGEQFTLDFTVVNSDNSPFILSDQYENPYLVITFSSTRQAQDGKFVLNEWLDLSNMPSFYVTQALPALYDDLFGNDTLYPPRDPEGIQYSDEETAVYFCMQNDEVKYRYYDPNVQAYKDYNMRIQVPFSAQDTEIFTERNYEYGISLKCGNTIDEYIADLYTKYVKPIRAEDNTTLLKYERLSKSKPDIAEAIDTTSPIGEITESIIILSPTKFTVLNNQNTINKINIVKEVRNA